jgi:prepilin-type processing-associated H-X9-DG protein
MAGSIRRAALILAALAPLCAVAADEPPAAAPEPQAGGPAPAPGAEAPQALPSPVLAYIPDDADLAVSLRVEQLVRTGIWKSLAAPEVGCYQRLVQEIPLRVDFEKDVAAAAFVVQVAWKDGKPLFASSAVILEMKRDVQASDILKGLFKAKPLGPAGMVIYPIDSGPRALALPTPRVAVLASSDGEKNRDEFLAKVLQSGAGPTGPKLRPPAAGVAPGEIVFAARASDGFKEGILTQYLELQRRLLRPQMDGDRVIEFGLYYNIVRIALQAEGLAGSLDLSRDADALRVDIRFASPAMAPFMVATLQAMADPLQMCLPALVGGLPLEEPPPEPFYRTTADGPVVHLVMSRQAVERLVDRLTASARIESARAASAENLRAIGRAILIYSADKGAYPQNWSALTKARLLPDPRVFENPALADHLAAGDYELVPMTRESARRNADLKVLAYEIWPRDARPPGLNVLLADGHVEYMEYPKFEQLYRQTLESLGR